MSTNYFEICTALSKEIRDNYDLNIQMNHIEKKPAPEPNILEQWPAAVRDFYSQLNGMEIHWESSDHSNDPPLSGRIRILEADQVDPKDQKPFWSEFTDENSTVRSFRLLDYFIDEAAVGFYQQPETTGEMYLYLFEAKPIPLRVDFEGYVRLMAEARGFFYWQNALLAISNNRENAESRDFQEKMPLLFPSFSYEAFKELYKSLMIK